MTLRPLHDRVMIRGLEQRNIPGGGTRISNAAKEKATKGEAVAVGSGACSEDGKSGFAPAKMPAVSSPDLHLRKVLAMTGFAYRRTLAVAVVACACLLGSVPLLAAEAPAGLVVRFGAQALKLPQAPEETANTRASLRRLIAESFDLPLISRFLLGTAWGSTNAAQHSEYELVFADYVETITTRLLAHYAGGRLTVTGERIIDGGVLVATELLAQRLVPLTIHWRLHAGPDGYKVVDVIVGGASLLITKRDEFAAIMHRDGVQGLIDILRRRTETTASR